MQCLLETKEVHEQFSKIYILCDSFSLINAYGVTHFFLFAFEFSYFIAFPMARKHLSISPVSAWTFKSPGHVLLSGVTRMDCSCHTNSCQTNFQVLFRVDRLLVICCLPHMGSNKRQKLLLLSYWHLQLSSKWLWYSWVVKFIITAGDWGRLCCDCSQPSMTFAVRFLVSKYPHFSAVQFFFVVLFFNMGSLFQVTWMDVMTR